MSEEEVAGVQEVARTPVWTITISGTPDNKNALLPALLSGLVAGAPLSPAPSVVITGAGKEPVTLSPEEVTVLLAYDPNQEHIADPNYESLKKKFENMHLKSETINRMLQEIHQKTQDQQEGVSKDTGSGPSVPHHLFLQLFSFWKGAQLPTAQQQIKTSVQPTAQAAVTTAHQSAQQQATQSDVKENNTAEVANTGGARPS